MLCYDCVQFYLFIQNLYKQIINKIRELLFNHYNNTKIVYKSEHFIIINKGYDLKINSNNERERTIQTFMKKKHPLLASVDLYHEYYFMHRLDYSTSGLMCIPLHKKACQVASKAIEQRLCKKYYIAIVRGYLSSNLVDLHFRIGRDLKVTEIEKMCVIQGNNSKSNRKARSVIVALEKGQFDNYPATKILIKPITGRRHQIRVHCSYIGHTIVGDYTYSNKKDMKPERMYLHSLRLVIPNEVENIDVATEDPFIEGNVKYWKSLIRIYNLTEAFTKIDDYKTTF